MARYHMTQDGKVPFTSKEEITRDAEEAQELVDRPMRTWLQAIAKTDSGMPRYLEDLITTNSLTMTPEMKVRFDKKIKIRGEQP